MGPIHLDGTANDLDEFANFFSDGVSWDEPSPGERRVTWASDQIAGRASAVSLRSGIQMTVANVVGLKPFELEIEHAPCELDFTITRGRIGLCSAPDGAPLPMSAGELQASTIKESTTFHCSAPQGSQDMTIHLSLAPEALCGLLGTNELPVGLRTLLSSDEPYAIEGRPMNRALYSVLDDLMTCRLEGAMRRLYLESKGLELVALLAHQFSVGEQTEAAELSPDEVARLHRARELLLDGLEAPPNLAQLARQSGLNERKLKMGFKALFGTPVFQYLRRTRMERAHELLSRGQHSVTEVALAVGYANPSKFAAAFRREYGLSPSTL